LVNGNTKTEKTATAPEFLGEGDFQMRQKQFGGAFEIKGVNAQSRTITGIASREQVDRDGDVVSVDGIITTNFLKNPTLLLDHDHKSILGTVTRLWVQMVDGLKALMFEARMLPEGASARADQAWAEIEAGDRRGISIGFLVRESQQNSSGGSYISSLELLEISSVSVPSCPSCLAQAKSCGCSGGREQVLQIDDEKHVILLDDESSRDRAIASLTENIVTRVQRGLALKWVPTTTRRSHDCEEIDIASIPFADSRGRSPRSRRWDGYGSKHGFGNDPMNVTREEVRAVLGEAVRESVAQITTDSVRRAMRLARGRVD
jgi:HK97 family phage prohead protease